MIDGLATAGLIFYSVVATYNWVLTWANNKHIRDMQRIEEEVHRVCHHTNWQSCSHGVEETLKMIKRAEREKDILEY